MHQSIVVAGDDFVVIKQNGVHEIGLDYCGCEKAQDPIMQLLCVCWYPATTTTPKSTAAFNVLEFFQLLSFESNTPVFEFYYTLMRRTNNTGTSSVSNDVIIVMAQRLTLSFRIVMKTFCRCKGLTMQVQAQSQ
jgi:hypothetical protein